MFDAREDASRGENVVCQKPVRSVEDRSAHKHCEAIMSRHLRRRKWAAGLRLSVGMTPTRKVRSANRLTPLCGRRKRAAVVARVTELRQLRARQIRVRLERKRRRGSRDGVGRGHIEELHPHSTSSDQIRSTETPRNRLTTRISSN
eukprot:2400079-Rhodomonas_salina.1